MNGARSAAVLVASNRGPVSFAFQDDGSLHARRGGGGLVSGLSAVAASTDVVWVCAALSTADRVAARRAPGGRLDRSGHDTGGSAVHMLDIDPGTFHRAYNDIANSTLWFIHHLLYDTATKPTFNGSFHREWRSYLAYNGAFADALAVEAAEGAKVVVQDYHLTVTPRLLRERRPDLRIGHFSHTPWAPPDYFRILPDDIGRDLLLGILSADHAGFLTARWANAFADCCEVILGAKVDREAMTVSYDGRLTHLGVHGLGADADFLRERSRETDVEARRAALLDLVGDRQMILRVDRTELSKNIVRGLQSYRELLRAHPELQGRVVHVALAYPSRHDLPEYREYTASVQRIAKQIEDARRGGRGLVRLWISAIGDALLNGIVDRLGASERQPCASKTAPYGAAPVLTTFFALAMNSSQDFGALLGSRPAFSTSSPLFAWMMMSSRNGNDHMWPS